MKKAEHGRKPKADSNCCSQIAWTCASFLKNTSLDSLWCWEDAYLLTPQFALLLHKDNYLQWWLRNCHVSVFYFAAIGLCFWVLFAAWIKSHSNGVIQLALLKQSILMRAALLTFKCMNASSISLDIHLMAQRLVFNGQAQKSAEFVKCSSSIHEQKDAGVSRGWWGIGAFAWSVLHI